LYTAGATDAHDQHHVHEVRIGVAKQYRHRRAYEENFCKRISSSPYIKVNTMIQFRLFSLNEVNSNVIFLFPIASGLIKGYITYAFLAWCIFIVSLCFHAYKYYVHNGLHLKHLRALDISMAITCYLYMAYFVTMFIDHNQLYFYGALIATVILFFFGKTKVGLRYNIHSYFHIAIGAVAGLIPLFA
jgi:cation transport ATPase